MEPDARYDELQDAAIQPDNIHLIKIYRHICTLQSELWCMIARPAPNQKETRILNSMVPNMDHKYIEIDSMGPIIECVANMQNRVTATISDLSLLCCDVRQFSEMLRRITTDELIMRSKCQEESSGTAERMVDIIESLEEIVVTH